MCASLAARFGRAVEQLKIVGVVRVEVKTLDVSAFERFGRGSETNGVKRGREFGELNEGC